MMSAVSPTWASSSPWSVAGWQLVTTELASADKKDLKTKLSKLMEALDTFVDGHVYVLNSNYGVPAGSRLVGPFGDCLESVYTADLDNGALLKTFWERGCRALSDNHQPLTLMWDTSTVKAVLKI